MKRTLITTFLCMPLSVFGAWQIIDDFNDEDFSDWNMSWDTPGLFTPIEIPSKPPATGLFLESTGFGEWDNNTWISKEIPGGIPVDGSATIYFRLIMAGLDNNFQFGTSDMPLEVDDADLHPQYSIPNTIHPGAWGDFNALIRMTQDNGFIFEHRDGGAYVATNPAYEFALNEWYEFWLYIENVVEQNNEGADVYGRMTVYIKGPDDSEPQVINVGTSGQPVARFRRAPLNEAMERQPLRYVLVATNSGAGDNPNAGDAFVIDDIAVYQGGLSLTAPGEDEGEDWHGYPIDEAGNVDAAGWLGHVNITYDPWVWSFSLNEWLYVDPAAVTEQGGWIYIPR